MSQLLLVSSGLGAVKDFVGGRPESLKLIFIPTASNKDKDPWWVDKDRTFLKDLGFQVQELDIANKTSDELANRLENCDVIYVAGGNTFYLLDAMQRSGFDQLIVDLLGQGKQYIGASAGAVVAGPDIEPVDGLDDPDVAPNLESTTGLGLVDFVVIPHTNQTSKEETKRIEEEFGREYPLAFINDDQAVIVHTSGKSNIIESK